MAFDRGETGRLKITSAGEAAARLLDLGLAAAVLLLLTPLMLLVAAAIVAETGRPIFFSQVRLGLNGRPFRMHKFRKFRERGPAAAGGSLTIEGDSRLSRIGGLLARTKLDELPQLWNIIRGEMAIVGPRPESLAFKDCFAGPYRAVLDHKPGIFGPSQVFFRNEGRLYRGCPDPEQFYRDVVFPRKAQLDLAYFPRRTLLRDIAWMVRGGLAVFGFCAASRQSALPVEQWAGRAGVVVGSRGLPPVAGLAQGSAGRSYQSAALAAPLQDAPHRVQAVPPGAASPLAREPKPTRSRENAPAGSLAMGGGAPLGPRD